MKKLLLLSTFLTITLFSYSQSLDIALNQITLPEYVNINDAPINVTGIVRNLGLQTVTSFDLNMSIDGGPAQTFSYSGLTLASGTNYNFLRLNAWNPEMLGRYSITMWTSNPNGSPDQNTVNDTATIMVEVVDEFVSRNAFHEVFTSSTCGPCRPGNIQTDNVWANSNLTPVIIKYQMSWPGSGDPYYTAEGGVRRNFYSVNSVPNMQIDGGWNGNSNSYTDVILNQFSAEPAFLEIESNFTVTGQTVDMNFAIKPLKDIKGNNRLYVAIIEKTTFNNIKSNGETEFHDVMKKMVPNANGTNVGTILTGQPLTYEFSYTFQGSYRLPNSANDPINHATEHSVEEFSDLNVIVWVQNQGGRDVFHASYSIDKPTNLDLSFASITTADVVEVNQDASIDGVIINNQSTPVTSFDVVYRINGGAEERQSVTGVNLAKGDSMMFSHGTMWQPSALGVYKVEAWIDNVNGAGVNTSDDIALNDEAFKYIVADNQVGGISVSEIAKTVSVYPNPSNGQIFINAISSHAKSVEVYTMMGESLSRQEMGQEGIYEIDMNSYPAGVYILRFNTVNGTFSKRIVVQ